MLILMIFILKIGIVIVILMSAPSSPAPIKVFSFISSSSRYLTSLITDTSLDGANSDEIRDLTTCLLGIERGIDRKFLQPPLGLHFLLYKSL